MSERQTERQRERETDRHIYKGERKRDVYESLPVNSFEHNEVVHSKRIQRKRIRTYRAYRNLSLKENTWSR